MQEGTGKSLGFTKFPTDFIFSLQFLKAYILIKEIYIWQQCIRGLLTVAGGTEGRGLVSNDVITTVHVCVHSQFCSSHPCLCARSTWRRCLLWCSDCWRDRRHLSTYRDPAWISPLDLCMSVTTARQVAQWDEENLFFYHFIFSASCCDAVKNIRLSFFRFSLELHCHKALQCEYSVCSTVCEFMVSKKSSFMVMFIFLWRDKLVHLFFI